MNPIDQEMKTFDSIAKNVVTKEAKKAQDLSLLLCEQQEDTSIKIQEQITEINKLLNDYKNTIDENKVININSQNENMLSSFNLLKDTIFELQISINQLTARVTTTEVSEDEQYHLLLRPKIDNQSKLQEKLIFSSKYARIWFTDIPDKSDKKGKKDKKDSISITQEFVSEKSWLQYVGCCACHRNGLFNLYYNPITLKARFEYIDSKKQSMKVSQSISNYKLGYNHDISLLKLDNTGTNSNEADYVIWKGIDYSMNDPLEGLWKVRFDNDPTAAKVFYRLTNQIANGTYTLSKPVEIK